MSQNRRPSGVSCFSQRISAGYRRCCCRICDKRYHHLRRGLCLGAVYHCNRRTYGGDPTRSRASVIPARNASAIIRGHHRAQEEDPETADEPAAPARHLSELPPSTDVPVAPFPTDGPAHAQRSPPASYSPRAAPADSGRLYLIPYGDGVRSDASRGWSRLCSPNEPKCSCSY
jgi:hypothetical protein